MTLVTIGLTLLAAPWASSREGTPVLDGRAAAGYAYAHVFDPSPRTGDDRTAFVTGAMAAGGWAWPRGARADALERSLDAQPGVVVREIAPASRTVEDPNAVAGDVLMADWGEGDDVAPAERNRASGAASEFMVVQGGLGKGDFVFCRNGAGHTQMGRFRALLDSPHLAQARYKLYHVLANDPTQGLRENALYRDVNQQGVFLEVNGGIFHAADDATVKAFGGWATLNTLPKGTLLRRDDVPVTGTMLRERNDVAVWLVDGRVRRHVRSDAGVKRLGGWEAVRTVPDGSIEPMFPREGPALF